MKRAHKRRLYTFLGWGWLIVITLVLLLGAGNSDRLAIAGTVSSVSCAILLLYHASKLRDGSDS